MQDLRNFKFIINKQKAHWSFELLKYLYKLSYHIRIAYSLSRLGDVNARMENLLKKRIINYGFARMSRLYLL